MNSAEKVLKAAGKGHIAPALLMDQCTAGTWIEFDHSPAAQSAGMQPSTSADRASGSQAQSSRHAALVETPADDGTRGITWKPLLWFSFHTYAKARAFVQGNSALVEEYGSMATVRHFGPPSDVPSCLDLPRDGQPTAAPRQRPAAAAARAAAPGAAAGAQLGDAVPGPSTGPAAAAAGPASGSATAAQQAQQMQPPGELESSEDAAYSNSGSDLASPLLGVEGGAALPNWVDAAPGEHPPQVSWPSSWQGVGCGWRPMRYLLHFLRRWQRHVPLTGRRQSW